MRQHDKKVALLNMEADRIRKEGDKKTAASLFGQAMQLMSVEAVVPELESAVCSNFGILCSSMGDNEFAVKLQRRALTLDEARGDPTDMGFSHHNLGQALMEAGQVAEGITHLEKALAIRTTLDDDRELAFTYEMLANAHLESGHLDEAEKIAKQGWELRTKLGRDPVLRGVLAALAAVAAKRKDWDRACEIQAEVIALLEERREQYDSLAKRDLYDSRYNKHYLDAIELFLNAKRYDAALALIDRTRFRSGCAALEGHRKFLSPLDPSALDFPAYRTDELVVVEWIYPKFDWSFPLPESGRAINARKIVTSTREDPQMKIDLATEWKTHFHITLGQTQKIIDAYEKELSQTKRIVLVPHGAQWQTPFAGLKDPTTGGLLADTHEVLLSPSLRYCRITDNRPLHCSGKHLVIGDPTNDLPGAKQEAETVAGALGVDPILGADVTRQRVLDMLGQGPFGVVHYAGHGQYGGDGLHALIVADGLITADDLGSINFSADLVSLASCWGGMTEFSVWTELYGFIRGLLISNVRYVIGSVYPLDDAAGQEFSTTFYSRFLKSGVSPVQAFTQAISHVGGKFGVEKWGGLYITGQRPSV